jgi:hypothetical protein
VWNALVVHMAQHHTTGAMKTVSACKSKYSRVRTVRDSLTFCLLILSLSPASRCLQHHHNFEGAIWIGKSLG